MQGLHVTKMDQIVTNKLLEYQPNGDIWTTTCGYGGSAETGWNEAAGSGIKLFYGTCMIMMYTCGFPKVGNCRGEAK